MPLEAGIQLFQVAEGTTFQLAEEDAVEGSEDSVVAADRQSDERSSGKWEDVERRLETRASSGRGEDMLEPQAGDAEDQTGQESTLSSHFSRLRYSLRRMDSLFRHPEVPQGLTCQEEVEIARSGDPGVSVDRKFDPWASGRWEQLERKRESRASSGSKEDDEIEAQSGDAGERILQHMPSFCSRSGHSMRRSGSSASSMIRTSSFADENRHQRKFPLDTTDTSIIDLSVFGIAQDELSSASPVTPLPTDILSPLSDMPLIPGISDDARPVDSSISFGRRDPHTSEGQVKERTLHRSLLYTSNLVHLATFGVLGVLIRYGLEVLFGRVLAVMNDGTPLFTDLVPNMVGSYFMGWVGIVLKKDISLFSEPLAVGLSTGLMGSITTFASWNQKMIALFAAGHWASALVGYVIGMELAQMSLLVGIETAKLLKWMTRQLQQKRTGKGLQRMLGPTPDNFHRQATSLAIFFCLSGSLWIAAVTLTVLDTESTDRRTLWLACVVGPPGVWARWHLARLNGSGVRSKFIWLPIGTLLTNLIAAGLEAALSIILLVVDDDGMTLIKALQLGFLGCMSTVSTFVTEVYTMYGGPRQSRAFAYILCTLLPAFVLGVCIYCVPSWAKNYVDW